MEAEASICTNNPNYADVLKIYHKVCTEIYYNLGLVENPSSYQEEEQQHTTLLSPIIEYPNKEDSNSLEPRILTNEEEFELFNENICVTESPTDDIRKTDSTLNCYTHNSFREKKEVKYKKLSDLNSKTRLQKIITPQTNEILEVKERTITKKKSKNKEETLAPNKECLYNCKGKNAEICGCLII